MGADQANQLLLWLALSIPDNLDLHEKSSV